MHLGGKVALVTGASGGIGQAIARSLAADGAAVALVGRRERELHRLADDIGRAGGTAAVLPGDLRDDTFLLELLDGAAAELGAVDILVNNAGVANLQMAHKLDVAHLDEQLAVNLRAPALLCAGALPSMRRRGYGRIINIASEAGVVPYVGMAAYASTKRALIGLTEVIQLENAERGIKAWALCPGMVDTDMGDDRGVGNRELFLSVSDVADTVVFLLRSSDRMMVGPQILMGTQRNPWNSAST